MGLRVGAGRMGAEEAFEVDRGGGGQQLPQMKEHLDTFGEDLPQEIRDQMGKLEERLGA